MLRHEDDAALASSISSLPLKTQGGERNGNGKQAHFALFSTDQSKLMAAVIVININSFYVFPWAEAQFSPVNSGTELDAGGGASSQVPL